MTPQPQSLVFGAQGRMSGEADHLAKEIPVSKSLCNTQKCYYPGVGIIELTPLHSSVFIFSIPFQPLVRRCIFNHNTTSVLVTAFLIIL